MIFSFKQFFAALVQSDRFVFGFVEYESQQSMQAAIEVSLFIQFLSLTVYTS